MSDNIPISFPTEGESKVELFQRNEIRKVLHEDEWWFSVKDVLEALTGTTDGTRYASDLRSRDEGLKASYSEITRTLKFQTNSGMQSGTFINIEGMFRLMQSVPSAKAEPFKKWIAKVGFERLQELQDPALAIKRAITVYRAKGFDDNWIDARIRNIASRKAVTQEWDKRGLVKYIGILTDAMSIQTFGISTEAHKKIKGLKNQSLRDNMTPIELTLTTLSEQTTTEIMQATNPKGLDENIAAARQGGNIAGYARQQIEKATKRPVVSSTNYLTPRQRENNNRSEFPSLDDILNKLLPKGNS